MSKNFVAFSMDADPAHFVAGYLQQLSVQVGTSRHIGPVLKLAHALMSDEFNEWMDNAALAASDSFHHVYEWNMVGQAAGRLFKPVLRGGGANRQATWEWRASKKTVPVTPEAQEVGVKQIHVFVWKAPAFEYNNGWNVNAKRGKGVSAFTRNNNHGLSFIEGGVWVENPGGEAVRGAFTTAFTSWWAGAGAHTVFESKIRHILEHDLGKSPTEMLPAPFRRTRTKTFGMFAASNPAKARDMGAMAANDFLRTRDRTYIEAAIGRERLINGE